MEFQDQKNTLFKSEYTFTPVFFGTRNPFHILIIERIVCGVHYNSDWQLHTPFSSFYVWILSQFYGFFFPIWHLHTFSIVLRPVTCVRNEAFNGALVFRALFVGNVITSPSIDSFCNYIFKLLYKILTAFTINILFVAIFYLCFHVI